MFESSVSAVVNLESNEEEAAVKDPVILVDVKLLINVAFVPKAPDISVAIWFELLTSVPANSISAVVNLVDIEALGDVNAPDIAVLIWFELEINVLDNSLSAVVNLVLIEALGAIKAPVIAVAI